MDLITIITIIGVVQGLFLSLNLLFLRSKKIFNFSKLFLGLLILFLCLHSIDSILTHTKLFYEYPHFFAVKDPFILLYGPLIVLYVQSLLNYNFKLKWFHFLHAIPFLIFLFRILPLYFRAASYKINILDIMYENYSTVRDKEINLILSLHVFAYLLASVFILYSHYLKNKSKTLVFKRKDLKHISIIISFVFITYCITMFRFWLSYSATTVLWMPLTISILFFIAAYKSLKVSDVIIFEPDNPDVKSLSRSIELVKSCDIEMNNNNLYLNPNIDLNEIALRLNTNRQYLSTAINDIKGANFTNYVNRFRVSKAKELLASKKYMKYSLEKIGKDSGFNSLSTFQRAFKDFEGISPSKFRKKK